MAEQQKHYTLRLILLGEAGAGKSCLFHRIKYKTFRDDTMEGEDDNAAVTMVTSRNRQYDTYTKQISLAGRSRVSLTVVDTASRERFQSLTGQYYRRANIVLLVCSLDSEYTLNRLTKWYGEAQYYLDDPAIVYAVCGLKNDLPEHEREVTLDMMRGFATHYNISKNRVFEVSARTGEGVKRMLKGLCDAAIEEFRRSTFGRRSEPEEESEQTFLLSGNSTTASPLRTFTGARPPEQEEATALEKACCNCVLL